MTTIAFAVQADYEKVIKLRDEVARLQTELDKMQGNGSQEAIEKLEAQLTSCRNEMKQAVTAAANFGSEIQQSVQSMSFATPQEQINALSYAIHENETAIAENVTELNRLRDAGQTAFQAGDTEGMKAITADIQAQVAKYKELQQQTEEYKSTLQALLSSGADTSIENITATIARLDAACDANRGEIAQLTEEYNRLAAQYDKGITSGEKEEKAILGRMQAIKGEITVRRSLIKEMQDNANALQAHATAAQKSTSETTQTEQATASLRTRMRELKEEMAALRLQGIDEQSEAYRRLRDELGRLQDVQGDIARQGSILANDERQFAGMQSGLQGITGAAMGAQAAIGLLGGEQKALNDVLVRSHYLMTITNSLQQVAQMLNKDSAFRLVTLAKAREWWNGLLAVGRGEEIADTAAQTAQTAATAANTVATEAETAAKGSNTVATGVNSAGHITNAAAEGVETVATIGLAGAFRMLGAAIKSVPVIGWILAAIGALIGLVTLVTKQIKKMNEGQKEATKKAKEFYKTVSEEAYKPIGQVKALQTQWDKLGNSLKDKEKFIKDNKDTFDSLGVSINDVADAERFFTSQADAFINAQIAKAKATVLLNQAMEKTKEANELEQEIDNGVYSNYKNTFVGKRWTGEEKEQRERLEQLRAEEQEMYDTYADSLKEQLQLEETAGISKSSKSDTSTSTKTEKDVTKDTSRYKELVATQGKERARAAIQMEQSIQQAQINAMQDGRAKTLAQIDLDYEAQKTAIEQWYEDLKETKIKDAKELWDADPQTKGKAFDESSVDTSYTEQEQTFYAAQMEENAKKRKESIQSIYKAEADAMRDFLKDYGTYQEQRQAIAEEYSEKIAKAETQGEKMSLAVEQQQKLQEIDAKFRDTTDWNTIFQNIDNYSLDYLKKLQGDLQDMLTADDLTADAAKAIGDQLNAVNKAIIDKSQTWLDIFGYGNERLREQKKLQEDLLNIQTQLNIAQQKQADILGNINTVKQRICELVEGAVSIDLEVDSLKLGNADELMEQLRAGGASDEQQGQLSQMFTQWAGMDSELQSVTGMIGDLGGEAEGATAAIEGMSAGAGGFASAIAIVETVVKNINMGVQGMNDLLEECGLSDSKFGKGWKSFAESSQYATDAFECFKSGDFMGTAANVVGSLRTLGDALGEWTGWSFFGESDKSLHDDMETLAYANEALKDSIDKLTDEMSKSTTSLSEATSDYETAKKNLEKMEQDTSEIMVRAGKNHSSGFFGIGSDYSTDHYVTAALTASDWEAISAAAGTTVKSADDFWKLTAEQMYNVSKDEAALYAKIKQAADDGHEDVAQYMDDYVDLYQQALDLENEYRSKLTAIDFDSVVSNFQSAIMDMEHTAADFADDFENMMKDAVVSSIMSETYAKQLQDWYEMFADYMKSGDKLELWEQNALKDEYDRIVADAQAEINALYDTLGWSREGYSQSATTGGFTAMTEDTAEELNGRFTALQEAGYQILAQAQQGNILTATLADSMDAMRDCNIQIVDVSRETMSILANSYLELQDINENTALAALRLVDVTRYLKSVKENTDKL